MQVHVRVCKECGEEYRPDIMSCADCGGDLEDVYDDGGGSTPAHLSASEEPITINLDDHRPLFQAPRAPDLVPMAERLQETGIAFHLVEESASARFSLLVHEADVKSGREALADLLAPHVDGDSVHALDTHYESGRYVKCPACGTELGSGATECAECGLTLGAAVPTCARCDSPLAEEGAECTACGGEPPVG